MKSEFILVLTHDLELVEQSTMAAAASGARLMIARTAGEALQIVCERDGELKLVVADFDKGSRGMTLLSALSMLRERLPVLAVTSTDGGDSAALAYANGAAACLAKPINATELEIAISALSERELQFEAV
jgi:DNA-binding response OmpR family regulator